MQEPEAKFDVRIPISYKTLGGANPVHLRLRVQVHRAVES